MMELSLQHAGPDFTNFQHAHPGQQILGAANCPIIKFYAVKIIIISSVQLFNQ